MKSGNPLTTSSLWHHRLSYKDIVSLYWWLLQIDCWWLLQSYKSSLKKMWFLLYIHPISTTFSFYKDTTDRGYMKFSRKFTVLFRLTRYKPWFERKTWHHMFYAYEISEEVEDMKCVYVDCPKFWYRLVWDGFFNNKDCVLLLET